MLDSASAILLHNCYKNMMKKEPFNLGPLAPTTHPIAFLLILCDELQEWNREAYGIVTRQHALAEEARLEISDEKLNITYITFNSSLPRNFSSEKKKLLFKLLEMGTLFKDVSIHSKKLKKLVLPRQTDEVISRPALEDLETLAKAIHELYNEKQLECHPDKPLKYPRFDDLTDSLKYSNLRMAMDIPEKLRQIGYVMKPAGSSGEPILNIPEEYIEYLAEQEHNSWIAERIASGWVLGDRVDAEKKTTLHLVPYNELHEDVKQLDRNPVQSIPRLLKQIGMAVYKK